MKHWVVSLWCADCRGEDVQGCFDGGEEFLEEEFKTPEAAHAAGESRTRACDLWRYEVHERE
jgi:hypothetical protein